MQLELHRLWTRLGVKAAQARVPGLMGRDALRSGQSWRFRHSGRVGKRTTGYGFPHGGGI